MKTLALAVSILAASAAGASAADLAARPYTKAPPIVAAIYDWSGFYVGANGGYGSSRNCFASQPGGVVVNPVLGGFVAGDGGCHNATGGFGGGQIGYRWQSGAWVFGLEAQGDWAALSGSNLNATFGGAASGGIVDRTRVDGFGLFTGQVGYAWNSALLYVKGGAAVTRDRYDLFTTIPANVFTAAGSETRWGGAVGVGLEYGFAPNWSVGIEYGPSVHGHHKFDDHLHGRRRHRGRRHPYRHAAFPDLPGCRFDFGPDQLQIWWTGRGEVLIQDFCKSKAPHLAGLFCAAKSSVALTLDDDGE